MSYELTSACGSIEAVIDDNCGRKKFLSIAGVLVKECNITYIAKEDYSDSTDWFFTYKGRGVKLHYNIYNGVSICNSHSRDNIAVTELASMLKRELF